MFWDTLSRNFARCACFVRDSGIEPTPIPRVLQFARKWNSGTAFRLRKETQLTSVCRPYASRAIEGIYPTRNGWIKIDASSFHPLRRILTLTRIIAASFSTLCVIRVDLSEATKDLVLKKRASGQVYYQLDYDVIVLFGLTELQAYLSWKSKVGHDAIPLAVF